jgi:hypothetical protein
VVVGVALVSGVVLADVRRAEAGCSDDAQTATPRVPVAFTPLPPGAIEPRGWLRDWAVAARDGITGHLDERSPIFQHCWGGYGFKGINVTEDGLFAPLEQGGYWLDGLVRLALVLHDEGLLNKARSRLDPVVDGVLRSRTTLVWWKDRNTVDSSVNWLTAFNCWAHSHMARAMLAYYEGTGDPRVLEALRIAYSEFPLPDISRDFTKGIPSEVNIDPMLELYRLTGASELLDQVLAFANRPSFQETCQDHWPNLPDPVRSGHGVCFSEGVRVPALLYPWTSERWMLDASLNAFEWAEKRHMLPYGVPSGEEFMAGKGAFRCTETCVVPCWIWSQIWLLRIAGEGRFADQAESAFFNAGPVPVGRDWQTNVYYQSPNRMSPTLPGAERWAPGGKSAFEYLPAGHPTACCVGNVNRLIPNYIIYQWMATPDNGLAATLYGPCVVSAKVGDKMPVKLTCETNYPFEETIRITVEPERDSEFPLYFRVPEWCRQPQISTGDSLGAAKPDAHGFAKVSRIWRKGDVVTLRFPMSARVVRSHENSYPQSDYFKCPGSKNTQVANPFASVFCGPLLFALPIADKDPNTVEDGVKWQYALDFDGRREGADIVVTRASMPARWGWQLDAPVTLSVPARSFDWQPTDAQPLPDAPVAGQEPATLRLVPYGCTKFRVSMFPVTAKAFVGSEKLE